MTAAATRSGSPARTRTAVPEEYKPSYPAAAIAAIAVFTLYFVTIAPSTWMWDTGEYMAAAKVLGLPHPPGNPFFVLLANVFGKLPLPGGYAQHINTLAAFCGAASAGLWFLVTERVLAGWLGKGWQRIVGASAATLIGATAYTVWNQSVVNEKVYTVSLLFFAIVSWLMLSWSDDPDGDTADRKLILVAYLLGLGYANHPAGFLAAPAAITAIAVRRWQTFLRWRLVVKAVLVLLIGLTPFLYEPIRAAHFPPINEGEPTACTTEINLDCTLSGETWQKLKDNINREQYGQKLERGAPYTGQVGMWWLYFKWQWLRDAHNERPLLQAVLAVSFLMLGLLGGWVHWKEERRTFWFFGPLMFTLTLALIYYLNFRYGWSQALHLGDDVQREVRDRDYFYIWSYSAWGVWAGIGLVYIWQTVAQMLDRGGERPDKAGFASRRSWLMATPLLLIALFPLAGNLAAASHRGQTFSADWGKDMLNSVEPYGIIITNGDNDTFPLWYAQEVEGVRQDVLVLVTSYLNTDWFVRQAIRQPVREYDAAAGPAIYRDREWPKPKGPPLDMSFAEADAIPPYLELREAQMFRQDNIVATVGPGYLTRDQIIVLRLIRDSYPERPLYFSTGGYARSIGLAPYMLRQGLVDKLTDAPIVASADTLRIGQEGFLDVQRSHALWTQVYRGPQSFIREGDWIDRASVGIPYTYVIGGMYLADALTAQGRTDDARRIEQTAMQMARAARLNDLLGGFGTR